MDLNQLRLEVDGVTRTFAEWTRDFVDSYYPHLGHHCYRVPALHFNQQPLGNTAPLAGSEPHLTLNDPDPSIAVGDLAHTIVLEKLDKLSHHLRATGQGPFFIISAVDYDNYLAKLRTPRHKAKPQHPCSEAKPHPPCSKPERQYSSPASEPEASRTKAQICKTHSRSKRKHLNSGSKHSNQTSKSQDSYEKTEHQHTPAGQDSQPKTESSDFHTKAQIQQCHPKSGHQLSHSKAKHEKSPSDKEDLCHPTPKTESETGDLGKDEEGEGKQLLPPRPSDRGGQRGELDILLLHKKWGVVMIEVKSVGHSQSSWQPSEEEMQLVVQRRVKKAQEQLHTGGEVLNRIMPDLQLLHITMVIALPYVTRQQLMKAVSTLSLDPNLRFLCKDDLLPPLPECPTSQPQTEEDNSDRCPQEVGGPGLLTWWQNTMGVDVCTELPLESMKTIVGRICGLMSVVSVWTTSRPRVEVRTPAQAIGESGHRLADIVLLPRQAEILAQPSLHRLWLTGPMGSGKTLMLQLKGRQWLKEGKRVIVINVRTASRGRPQGHVLEKSIRREMESDSGTGSVERHDIALYEFHFESLHQKLVAGGPITENACFVVDEVLCEMSVVPEMLVKRYPKSPVWCVATYVAPVPDTFQCWTLGAVLRSPPSIQLMLKELDLNTKHTSAYTTRSAARGLPCDGPPIIFIDHTKHNAHVRPLDCEQCGHELADIFETKLGLKMQPPAPKDNDHLSKGPVDLSLKAASFQPNYKDLPSMVETTPLSFQDVLILVVPPLSILKHIKGYHWETSIPEALQFGMYLGMCKVLTALRQRGVPFRYVVDNTQKEIAFPPKDEVIMSDVMGAHSLERRVVVLLRCGAPLTLEEVTENISRYQTIQADPSVLDQTEINSIRELLKSPLDHETVTKQVHLFATLMYEIRDMLYPQLTIEAASSTENAEAIFHSLLENMMVAETQSFTGDNVCKEDPPSQQTQLVSGTYPSSTVLRRGMEYRYDVPRFPDPAHNQEEGTEASAAQRRVRYDKEVKEADSSFFVPDVQEDIEQRQEEVERIQRAIQSFSEDDLDWEFFAASRCLSQYISIIS